MNDPHVKLQLVQAKWFIGMSDYTDEEIAIMKTWFAQIQKNPGMKKSLMEFTRSYGTKEQIKKLREWEVVTV